LVTAPTTTTTTTEETTTTSDETTTTLPISVRRNRRSLRKKEQEVECPTEGVVFLPHQTDCASYFICNEGEAILRRCAANLVFDLMSNNCNFPAQSVCVIDHHKQAENGNLDGGNVQKQPESGLTAATPSKTAATPMGPAPIRWH
jgi:Chitin binding Peritrophin-A domain